VQADHVEKIELRRSDCGVEADALPYRDVFVDCEYDNLPSFRLEPVKRSKNQRMPIMGIERNRTAIIAKLSRSQVNLSGSILRLKGQDF
jgi:hypothetical protein